jgi:hypothetical protein
VLPSHGVPFTGLQARIHQTLRHHEERLQSILSLVTSRTQAFDVAKIIFPRAMPVHARQALGETAAHLNRLVRDGRLDREIDADGRILFSPINQRQNPRRRQ